MGITHITVRGARQHNLRNINVRIPRHTLYAPIVRGRKGEFREQLEALDQQGCRARIDGEMTELTEGMRLEKRKNHTIEAVVDRIILKPVAPSDGNGTGTKPGAPGEKPG